MHDPIGSVDRATPVGQRWEPPEPWWLRVPLFELGPWLASKTGREPRIGSRLPSIGSLRLG
jgi:hypothetical protein